MRSNEEMIIEIKRELAVQAMGQPGRQKKSGRMTRGVFLAVVLILALSLSAFAAYKLMIPKEIGDSFGTEFENVRAVVENGKANADTVNVIHKSIESGEYIITFEALADSSALRNVFEGTADHTTLDLSKRDTYALFTIRRADGAAIEFDGWDLNFTVCLKGYAPNIAFPDYHAAYNENGILWYAAQVTDAKVFGGEELYIALHECRTADWEYFRMNENGEYYFTDRYQGIRAIFELPLENDGLDPRTKEQFMEDRNIFIKDPDYSWYDAKAAKDDAFKASGVDLTPFIGEHEWLGSNPLQFGKVDMAEEYTAHRDDWKSGTLRLLTCEEADAIADKASAALTEAYDLETIAAEDEALFEAAVVNAAFSPDFFPADASYLTLSDGSKAYYLPCGTFIHLRNDGTAGLVCVPCADVVVEVNGIDPLLNTRMIIPDLNTGMHSMLSGVVAMGWYIDGTGFDSAYPALAGGDIEGLQSSYEATVAEVHCREDAVYALAGFFWGYDGTIEVTVR